MPSANSNANLQISNASLLRKSLSRRRMSLRNYVKLSMRESMDTAKKKPRRVLVRAKTKALPKLQRLTIS